MIMGCTFYRWGNWRLVKIVSVRVGIKPRFIWGQILTLWEFTVYYYLTVSVFKAFSWAWAQIQPDYICIYFQTNVLTFKTLPKATVQSWSKSLINSPNVFWKTKNQKTLFFSKTGSGSRRFFFYRSVCLSNQNSLIATFHGPSTTSLSKRRKWGVGYSFY